MRLEFIFVHVNEMIDNQKKRLTAVGCDLHTELRHAGWRFSGGALTLIFVSFHISWRFLVFPFWVFLTSVYILVDSFGDRLRHLA
jgi:hypothetical protein